MGTNKPIDPFGGNVRAVVSAERQQLADDKVLVADLLRTEGGPDGYEGSVRTAMWARHRMPSERTTLALNDLVYEGTVEFLQYYMRYKYVG